MGLKKLDSTDEIKDKLLKFSSTARAVTRRGSAASISPSLWRQFCRRRRHYI